MKAIFLLALSALPASATLAPFDVLPAHCQGNTRLRMESIRIPTAITVAPRCTLRLECDRLNWANTVTLESESVLYVRYGAFTNGTGPSFTFATTGGARGHISIQQWDYDKYKDTQVSE